MLKPTALPSAQPAWCFCVGFCSTQQCRFLHYTQSAVRFYILVLYCDGNNCPDVDGNNALLLTNSEAHKRSQCLLISMGLYILLQVQDNGQGSEVRVRDRHPWVLQGVGRGPGPGAEAAARLAWRAAHGGAVPLPPLALGGRHLHERPQWARDNMDEEVPGQEKVVIMSDKLLDIKMWIWGFWWVTADSFCCKFSCSQ